MWVKSAVKTMTEHSGQPNSGEELQRTVSEHCHQIHTHGTTLRSLLEQQQESNQQLGQLAAMLQERLGNVTAHPSGGAVRPLLVSSFRIAERFSVFCCSVV
ncbi:hypothetical protein ILYODFUR_009427 [Ilyodon furcidens]|uniref:Uncharacterized protein n=1 Tax=Ilyodon furcidens TaxID=33524 RepID=A0ABV0T9Y4_9TELE